MIIITHHALQNLNPRFALLSEISLILTDHISQRLSQYRSYQRQHYNISTLLIKERCNTRSTLSISRSTYSFPANDYKKRLELPEYVEIGINRFLTHNNPRSSRVSYPIASRLTLSPVETGFDPRRRRVIATDRMIFISDFPCM